MRPGRLEGLKMNAGRSCNTVARGQHLDGPARPVAGRKGAFGRSKPVKFEGGSCETSIGTSPEDALDLGPRQLVVEMEPAAPGDDIGLTLAHVALNRRHALLDLGRIISAEVDVNHNAGGGADRLHVDPEAKVWIEDDDAERTGAKLTLDSVVSLARSVRPTGVARSLAIERVDAETFVAKGVRGVLDGSEIQTHGFEKFGREPGFFDAVLDDHWPRRRASPCRLGRLVDRFSRPCAPALRDRPPVAVGAQMLEFEDVAAMGAAGETVKAPVATKAQRRLAIRDVKRAIDLRPSCAVEAQTAEYSLKIGDGVWVSGVVETCRRHFGGSSLMETAAGACLFGPLGLPARSRFPKRSLNA
jgi:hypothetical protein